MKNTEKEKQEEVLNFLRDNFSFCRGSIGIKDKIMLAKSHMAFGLLGGLGVMALVHNQVNSIILLPLVVFGSILPDIDEPRSFIGRKFPIISHIVSLSFTHRGFTHFFIFPFLIALLGLALLPYYKTYALICLALSLGILLHQIGDMLTISGIPYYFFPLSSKKAVLLPRFLRFKTGGKVEKMIFSIVLVPLVALFGYSYLDVLNNFDINKIINTMGELS